MIEKRPVPSVWRSGVRMALVLATLLALAGPGAFAAEGEDRPSDPVVEKEMLRIRGMLYNAEGKFRNNIIGIVEGAKPGAEPTPAQQCCSMNLRLISEAITALELRFDVLSACHDAAEQAEAVVAVEFARGDLVQLKRGMSLFAQAKERRQAGGVLGALTRAFNLLRESVDAIEPCEALPAASDRPGARRDAKGAGADGS